MKHYSPEFHFQAVITCTLMQRTAYPTNTTCLLWQVIELIVPHTWCTPEEFWLDGSQWSLECHEEGNWVARCDLILIFMQPFWLVRKEELSPLPPHFLDPSAVMWWRVAGDGGSCPFTCTFLIYKSVYKTWCHPDIMLYIVVIFIVFLFKCVP